ncbi:hypothetical protein BBP40_012670 [Aspergillus hancockii]|nr:hypothetical protein BBP40_012670 [Aspergillus hancockii]
MATYTTRDSLEFSDSDSDNNTNNGPYSSTAPSFRLKKYTGPLINYVRNEWQSNPKYSSLPTANTDNTASSWIQMLGSIATAPRFRRYVVVYLSVLVSCFIGWKFVLSPRLEEQAAILRSLDLQAKEDAGGWFGANTLPTFEDIVQLRALEPSVLPAEMASGGSGKRLVFIGDVHGCKDELERLLEEVSFNPDADHLIFTGDLINKGPDSLGVVDLARKYSASCVRGNHEDRVLSLRHNMITAGKLADDSKDDNNLHRGLYSKERTLARQMSEEQANWLDTCPVILNVGQIKDMGQVVVVHAGLIPGVDLEKQDPYSVMNMLTVDLETHVPSSSRKGTKWTKLFNKHQSLLAASLHKVFENPESMLTTVIYGHDSKSSLSLKSYTKGIGTGCVKGGKLTALVVGDGGEQNVVQVKCNDHSEE